MQEMDGKEIVSDLQTKVEEREQKEGNRERISEFIDGDGIGFLYCLKLWTLSLAKALVIVTPVLVLLWIFFLPALVLRGDLLQDVKDMLYGKVRTVFSYSCVYGFTAIYGISIFGYYFTKKALFFCFIPSILFEVFSFIFISTELWNFVLFFVFFSSIIIIYRQKLPKNPPQKLIEEFERKNKVAKPLCKMVVVLFVSLVILFNTFLIFLNSDFQSKLFLRFILLPIIMMCCTSLQMHFIKGVQKKHMDFLIPMLWITNGLLKICERIFTNSLFDSGEYLPFVAATFAAALIEIVNHVTYFHRHTIGDKITTTISKLMNGKNRSIRTISVIPNKESHLQNEKRIPKFMDKNEFMLDLRKKSIIEDISIELMMIFTVTFLLYFAHPLVDNEKVQKISKLEICIIQLLIQVIFEFLSDVFGIYWTITRHKIQLKTSDVEIKNRWFWGWILFILWQSLLFFWYLLSY